MKIPVDKITENPDQPRKYYDKNKMNELTTSIKDVGIINPITVREIDGGYVLIDGERRLRAVRMLGWDEIEAYVRPADEIDNKILTLIANLQRVDLLPSEEGAIYKELVEIYGSKSAVSNKIGVSIPTISIRLDIMEFDERIRDYFDMGKLPLTNTTVHALKRLSPNKRTYSVDTSVSRGWGSKEIVSMCKRIALGDEPKKKILKSNEIDETTKPYHHFDVRSLVSLPLPPIMDKTARETCTKCELYKMANKSTCGQCPLVTFLIIYMREHRMQNNG